FWQYYRPEVQGHSIVFCRADFDIPIVPAHTQPRACKGLRDIWAGCSARRLAGEHTGAQSSDRSVHYGRKWHKCLAQTAIWTVQAALAAKA
ncbi:MAG: hypothetical protein Q4B99_01595, partial [Clostridia bacterium]|nr:hypothetical protein [Clostridia bacterium]